MSYKVEVVPSPKSNLGEGPHWDEITQSLYYNDIYGKEATILRYDFKENKTYSATIDGEPIVSFIIPVANSVDHYADRYAVGIGRRVGIIQWDGKSSHGKLLHIGFEVEEDDKYKNNRFNDAKADPIGRFYGGTMRFEELGDLFEVAGGSFYQYTKGEGVKTLLQNIYVSNGLAWNEDIHKFYYIDSVKLDVKEFDYDPMSGDISNPRVVIDFRVNGERPGFIPDGMTIDTEGNLYVATWGGSKVLKVNPESGKILLEIDIPAKQVTSVAFGGPNLDILYVTTAATTRDSEQPPLAGHLFKVTGLNATGLPGVQVRCWITF